MKPGIEKPGREHSDRCKPPSSGWTLSGGSRVFACLFLAAASAHTLWTAGWFDWNKGRESVGTNAIYIVQTGIPMGRALSIAAPAIAVVLAHEAFSQIKRRAVLKAIESVSLAGALLLGILSWAAFQTMVFGQKAFGVLGW